MGARPGLPPLPPLGWGLLGNYPGPRASVRIMWKTKGRRISKASSVSDSLDLPFQLFQRRRARDTGILEGHQSLWEEAS